MNKIKLLLILVASTMLLTACNNNSSTEGPIILEPDGKNTESSSPTDPSSEGTTPPVASEDDTFPPVEGMLRSKLTNEWVDEDVVNTRPVAMIIPNEAEAIPHYNLSKASVLYEANVEGSMTRLLAVYDDWKTLEKTGNVRSLRLYFGYWATEWDAFLVHFGGPYYIDDFIAEKTTQNVNGLLGSDDAAFFRSSDRPRPHNAYITGENLLSVINKKGYSLSYRGLADNNHYNFTAKANPNTLQQYSSSVDATYIDLTACYPSTRTYFKYDESDGQYYRYQHLSKSTEGPHMDEGTGEQLHFKNVIIQNTKHERIDEQGYLAFQCHDTTRDGWYFTNGKGIHVTWKKTSDYGATRYYDDNGDEIVMNTGKTMVCIVEDGDVFSYN